MCLAPQESERVEQQQHQEVPGREEEGQLLIQDVFVLFSWQMHQGRLKVRSLFLFLFLFNHWDQDLSDLEVEVNSD